MRELTIDEMSMVSGGNAMPFDPTGMTPEQIAALLQSCSDFTIPPADTGGLTGPGTLFYPGDPGHL